MQGGRSCVAQLCVEALRDGFYRRSSRCIKRGWSTCTPSTKRSNLSRRGIGTVPLADVRADEIWSYVGKSAELR
jgi:hypothetical protein